MKCLPLALAFLAVFPALAFGGGAYQVGEGQTVVGATESYTVSGGESLHEVAVKAGLGYNEIADANPGVDPWLPGYGTELVIPRVWILPDAPQKGIVINLSEMRLYHYVEEGGRKLVRTYPVGIGREAYNLPAGAYTIIEKLKDPPWIVPDPVRMEDPSLPSVVPPGPDNPLGKFALRLSDPEYLIHGTNRPFGIGRRVSRGCIRMYPNDIEELYGSVRPGTRVRIVYQPVKVGERGGVVFVEVHNDDLTESEGLWDRAVLLLSKKRLLSRTNTALLHDALESRTGVPVAVEMPEEASLEKAETRNR